MSHDRPKATVVDVGVLNVLRLLSAEGIDPKPLLKRVGLDDLDWVKRNRLAPVEVEAGLIGAAALETGDTAFAIRVAETASPRDGGLFFYLSNTAPTLREALVLHARYVRAVNVSLRLTVSEAAAGGASLQFHYVGLLRRELNYGVEFYVAGAIRFLREFAGRPVNPVRVEFSHRRSFGVDAFERYFGCPVRFGRMADRLEFSRETLEFPLPGADRGLHEILRADADRAAAARIGPMASFRVAVENEIQNLLPIGSASIDAIADALGTSARSLSRRLNEEGTSYSELLDALRRTMALQYVVDPGLSVDRIADLLGYGDGAAFTHAFRRWTGRSPSSVRANPSELAPSADDRRA